MNYLWLKTVSAFILTMASFLTADLLATEGLQAETLPSVIKPEEWICAGPMPVHLPSFSEKKVEERAAEMLDLSWLDLEAMWPAEGEEIPWPFGEVPLKWMKKQAIDQGLALVETPEWDDQTAQVAYVGGYMELFQRQTLTLKVNGDLPFAIYCDGEEKGRIVMGSEPKEGEFHEKSIPLDLVVGKHRIMIKSLYLPGKTRLAWNLKFEISVPGEVADFDMPVWSVSPERYFTSLKDSQFLISPSQISLSPDAPLLAVCFNRVKPSPESWIELLDTGNGECLHLLKQGSSISSPQWAPDGKCMAYRSGRSIWIYTPGSRTSDEILHDQKGLGLFFWAPDSSRIYFITTEAAPEKGDYERLFDPRDRLTDWNTTARLNVIMRDGQSRTLLTSAGDFALTQAAVSPDGRRLALVIRRPIPERPFFETEFWLMDTDTGTTHLIKKTRFCFENGPAHLTWSPDSSCFAFTAPPGETSLPGQGEEYNAFDTCLWIMDVNRSSMKCLSDRFDAAVSGSLWWRTEDQKIYFIAQERAFRWLAKIHPDQGGLEIVTQCAPGSPDPTNLSAFAPALHNTDVALIGSRLDYPNQVYIMPIDGQAIRMIKDPNTSFMKSRKRVEWERFDYTNPDGQRIDGWIFYPPRFDAARSWPMIVYFYGGVAPEEERFSITYYQWLAAHGYILYVVNPSGAVGYGHDFAKLHCNDWGRIAGRDIILGVKEVLARKPFVDPARVGAYGGSYGGFMTLSLVTQTDLFKAACSMYGISNLTSYWGAGVWGYTYGDTA
ncbi:MAG: prolyl oligopeptidase family serine peptidase, partial [Planctomycetota bacterium]